MGGALAALASLQFGVIVVVGKRVLERGMSVESMLAFRFAVAGIVLTVALVALGRPLIAAPGERKGLALLAVFGYGVEATFFFTAAQHGTAAAVTLLFFTYPVFVMLGAWAFGRGARPVSRRSRSCARSPVPRSWPGRAPVCRSRSRGSCSRWRRLCTFSGYLVGADFVLRTTNPMTSAMWVSGGASVGLFLFAAISGRFTQPTGSQDVWAIVVMGFASAGAFVCLMGALQRIGAVRTAIVSATEPLSAALLGYLYLGESVSAGTAAGGALILVGAVLASLARAVTPREQQIP